MSPPHAPAASGAGKPVSAESGALMRTIVNLWPFIWPHDRADLQRRVGWAMVLLVVAKVVTMVVPFTFKWATDALAAPQTASTAWWAGVLAAPLALTLAYGLSRILMAVVTQMRDGLFAKVSMHAVRRLALLTFEHMHKLSLRFHLERKTGGLTRVLERGRNAIETIVRMIILQLLPTILELAMIVGVLLWMFDWRYVVVILVTVAAYLAFTYYATEWRIAIRRDMNDSDTNANVKAIDSLLNFETVKYFSAEEREKARYDVSMAKYEKASTKALTSLAVLNAGQAAIFTAGMTVAMVLCAIDIAKGRNTVGDFVMINAMMIQLYQPLNFMGMVYREIKQAVTDIESMFAILGRPPEIVDRPPRQSSPSRAARSASRMSPSPMIRRGLSSKASPSTCPPARPWRSSARQVPASRPSPAFFSASTMWGAGASPSTARTSARSPRRRCAAPSAWSRRTPCCSTTRSATTSATAAGMPPTPRWKRPRGSHRSTISSCATPRATRPRWASAA